MELKIFPYTKKDGLRTRTDSGIMALYDQMATDGSAGIVFSEGHIDSRESFLKYMKAPGTYLFVLKVDDEIVGVTWLDEIKDKTAFNHFCVFSNFWGKDTVALGKTTLQKLIHIGDEAGYVFEVFLGKVPAWNKRAVEFAQACGGVNLGVIPYGIKDAAKEQNIDAVLIYYTRETF